MFQNIECPRCRLKMRVLEEHLGKLVRCPKCQNEFSGQSQLPQTPAPATEAFSARDPGVVPAPSPGIPLPPERGTARDFAATACVRMAGTSRPGPARQDVEPLHLRRLRRHLAGGDGRHGEFGLVVQSPAHSTAGVPPQPGTPTQPGEAARGGEGGLWQAATARHG